MALPGALPPTQGFGFSVEVKGKAKGFVWVWQERIDPKKPRAPNPSVLAVRVANQMEKAALLAADSDKFFTEPHYNGFPAVLVRLPLVTESELRQLITEAWRCQAPKGLVAAYDADEPAAVARAAKPPAGKPPVARSAAARRSPGTATARSAAARPTTKRRAVKRSAR